MSKQTFQIGVKLRYSLKGLPHARWLERMDKTAATEVAVSFTKELTMNLSRKDGVLASIVETLL